MTEKNDFFFLKEAGVKFLPFVGDNYENGISFDEEGRLILGTAEKPGKKVLIINQCHYCDEDLTDEEMSSFTRDVLEWYLDARKCGNTTLWMNTFLKFERALANEITEAKDSASIWGHLMFYNYLQVPLKGARMSGNQGSVLSCGMETREYNIDGKRIKVLPVCHPAADYSWDYWHEIIVDFLNGDSIETMDSI